MYDVARNIPKSAWVTASTHLESPVLLCAVSWVLVWSAVWRSVGRLSIDQVPWKHADWREIALFVKERKPVL